MNQVTNKSMKAMIAVDGQESTNRTPKGSMAFRFENYLQQLPVVFESVALKRARSVAERCPKKKQASIFITKLRKRKGQKELLS